ncbi:hypothetical protein M8J77_018964 [Diaphorina citri]|nr:hypothetical protein M8J77_018964 [Diaphorina citri]
MSFNPHIANIVQSAFKTLGFIMRTLQPTDDPESYLLLFQSLVLSKLTYASVVWMPSTKSKISLIDSVQAAFCRRLFFKLNGFYPVYPNPISYRDLRGHLCLPSIESRHKLIQLQFLHKVIHDSIDSMDLVNDICYRVPCTRIRSNELYEFFAIPRSSHSNLSPIYRALTEYNKYHSDAIDIDLSVPYNQVLKTLKNILYNN